MAYRVAEVLRREVPTERMYIVSIGSQQGNRHIHWHVAPLPPGAPYEEQQLQALDLKRGLVAVSEPEMAALAERLRPTLRWRCWGEWIPADISPPQMQ